MAKEETFEDVLKEAQSFLGKFKPVEKSTGPLHLEIDNDPKRKQESNLRHSIFINEMVEHGNRRLAYQAAYPGTSNASACTSAWRLISNPDIATRIMQELLVRKNAERQLIKEEYDGKIADIEEKRAILAQIMRGELVDEKEISKKGEKQTIRQNNSLKDRMKAIMLDTRLEEEWQKALIIPNRGVGYRE